MDPRATRSPEPETRTGPRLGGTRFRTATRTPSRADVPCIARKPRIPLVIAFAFGTAPKRTTASATE